MNEKEKLEFMRENNYDPNMCMGNQDELQKPNFTNELMNIETNYLMGDNSWNPTRVDAFKKIVEQKFLLFPLENKVSWDNSRGVDGKLCIELTVRTQDLGQLSTGISIEILKSDNCPANLPDQLFEAFKVKFENKKQRLLNEWQQKNEK